MTERGLLHSDTATACPFVAFEDDRDERSDRPDHRHRCYAEIPPAPRAIAHQEAYCLASAFAVCPTFQEWAQREAARTRLARESGVAAAASGGDGSEDHEAGAAGSAAREVAADPRMRDEPAASPVPADEWRGRRPTEEHEPLHPMPPRRNPPRDWAAPPPWAGGAGSGAAGGLGAAAGGAAAGTGAGVGAGAAAAGGAASHLGRESEAGAPRSLGDRHEGRGLAGSAADRLASGDPPAPRPPEAPQRTSPVHQATPSHEARGASPPEDGDHDDLGRLVGAGQRNRTDEDTNRYRPPAADGDGPANDRAESRRRAGAPRASDDAPSWERPRRYEAYPTIKSRPSMPGLPRIGIMVAALTLAALVLFALPGLLGWFDGENAGPGALPSPSPIVETPSPEPTEPPAPTPQNYTIKSGDTLSKVAKRFDISLDELLEANRETIKNPDRIAIGDVIIIPPPTEGGDEEEAP